MASCLMEDLVWAEEWIPRRGEPLEIQTLESSIRAIVSEDQPTFSAAREASPGRRENCRELGLDT